MSPLNYLGLAGVAVFLVGLTANSVVLGMLWRKWRELKRHVITHSLINLAVSDIIYLSVLLKISVDLTLGRHILGSFGCRLSSYLDMVGQHVSAWTIVSMSHERHLAMSQPFEYSSRWTARNLHQLLAIWASALLVATPIAIFSTEREDPVPQDRGEGVERLNVTQWNETQTNETFLHCGSDWPSPLMDGAYFTTICVLDCVLPAALMATFYVSVFRGYLRQLRNPRSSLHQINQRKLTMVLFMIVMSFFCSYIPFYASQTFIYIGGGQARSQIAGTIFIVSVGMTYFNSILNPLLYSSFTGGFSLLKTLIRTSSIANDPNENNNSKPAPETSSRNPIITHSNV